jgi:Arc/MetJ-type ribon-helix-helix transcriptional regulator
MAIEITPEVREMVLGLYSSGQYANETEVVSVAVRLLLERQQLVAKLEQGRRELADGQRLPASGVFADLRMRAQELDSANS